MRRCWFKVAVGGAVHGVLCASCHNLRVLLNHLRRGFKLLHGQGVFAHLMFRAIEALRGQPSWQYDERCVDTYGWGGMSTHGIGWRKTSMQWHGSNLCQQLCTHTCDDFGGAFEVVEV